jgi:hypothetical protein
VAALPANTFENSLYEKYKPQIYSSGALRDIERTIRCSGPRIDRGIGSDADHPPRLSAK